MTKIKATKKRKAGKVPASVKETSALSSGKNLINAERNGKTRTFSPLLWDNLPPDKDGWKETLGVPSDITVQDPDDDQDDDKNLTEQQIKARDAYANYVTHFGKQPDSGLTTEELIQAVQSFKDEQENMVDHVITQEDLDLNPELATSGVKVGDTVKFPKEGGDK